MPLTEKEKDTVTETYLAGANVPQIARAMGIGAFNIYAALHERGVNPAQVWRSRAGYKLTPADKVAIGEKYLAGALARELMDEYGVTVHHIGNVLRDQAIPFRHRGPSQQRFKPEQVAEMKRRWDEGESQRSIGLALGVHQTRVSRELIRHGYQPAKRLRRGAGHGNWKGGRASVGGYMMVKVASDSPYASMRRDGSYVLEHRLVVAQQIGRPLETWETVHHIDGNRSNNAPDNLQLRTGHHGTGVALECIDCGSRNVRAVQLAIT